MKLSIVVPVYNVEQYVRKCILSIINQDDDLFMDIELIIVNDGSKDKSVEQIQDLVDKYDNITLINQENLSLSVARNNGMAVAKGDYVWFIDSDDWITCDAVKVVMPYLDNDNDIITINYTVVKEDGEYPVDTPFCDAKTLSGKESFRQHCEFSTMAQRGIYRVKFMTENDLVFMPGVYNQDDELCLRASYIAKTVTILPKPIYYFLRTTGDKHKSIMNNVKPKLGYDYLTVSKSLADFSEERIKEKDLFKSFQQHIAVLINMGLRAISKCPEDAQKKFIEMYKELGLKKCYYRAGGKYLVVGILFSLFPSKMVKIYKLLKSE
ncbi:MAG: glycosyltransferase [Bacteroidaceae bacterium]|nr:glycosyltransferase [Bacteroidaceae bacterium]